MTSNIATTSELFDKTLTEVGKLVDNWEALSGTEGSDRFIRLKFNCLKLCVPKHDDAFPLQVKQLHQLVELRVKSEPIDQPARSVLDEILQDCIRGVKAAFANEKSQLFESLLLLAVSKKDLERLPSWDVDERLWDDCLPYFVRKLSKEADEQLGVSEALYLFLPCAITYSA